MDFDLQNASVGMALTTGTLLHDRYRILCTVSIDGQSIIYEAADGAENTRVCIREYCPMDIAARNGLELVCDEEDEGAFLNGAKQFVRCGKLLRRGIPHITPVTALFNANGTSYITSDMPEGMSLSELKIPLTPTYVQSLGIALCDSFAALHDAGLYYGTVREEHLCFADDGTMLLSPEPIRMSGSVTEDLHALRAFLSSLMPPGETDDPADGTLRKALTFSYKSAASLRKALIAEKDPVRFGSSRSGIVGLLLCLVFFAGAVFAVSKLPRQEVQLAAKVETGTIRPQVISVWAPLKDGADEKEACAMYEQLAAGFEKQHPGCGVKLRLYADNSFSEAVAKMDEAEEQPIVLMDTQDPAAAEHAADLTNLTFALEEVYVTDMTQFTTFVPLACSIPVLLYNEHRSPELAASGADTIGFDALPSNTLFDVSAAAFITAQGAKQQPAEQLESFLGDGKNPIVASSSCIVDAEHTGISSGAVHMLPVQAGGKVPLQYEMYCSVNTNASPDSQQIGILWLQYLLTEEAQQILFVEHYSDLPIHKKALESAVQTHRELHAVTAVLDTKTGEVTP